MKYVCIIGLSIVLLLSMIFFAPVAKGAANLEIVNVIISPDKPKTCEPAVILVIIVNHEGIGQYFTLTLSEEIGGFVSWDGFVASISGYANPYELTSVSFIISPIAAVRTRLGLYLEDYAGNTVDSWEGWVTIEKGELEANIDSINSSLSSVNSDLNVLNSNVNSLNNTITSQIGIITNLQASMANLEKQLKETQKALSITQAVFAITIVVVIGAFSGFLYRQKISKKV
jgi:hypothetical protein